MWWKEKYFGSFCTSIFFSGFDSAAKLPNSLSAEIRVQCAGQLWSCQCSWPTQELQLRLGAAAFTGSAGLGVPFGLSKPPVQCSAPGQGKLLVGVLGCCNPNSQGACAVNQDRVGCKTNRSCRRRLTAAAPMSIDICQTWWFSFVARARSLC